MIQYAIASVPERHDNAVSLADRLAADLIVDHEHRGHVWTHREAWGRHLDRETDGALVVLEDDVRLCSDFDQHIQEEIDALGRDEILSLYMGRRSPTRDQAQLLFRTAAYTGAPLSTPHVFNALGLGIPFALIDDMLEYTEPMAGPWDEIVESWVKARDLRVRYSVPSHIDHLDLPTTLPRTAYQPRPQGRVAWSFCKA
ncbi:hypothetical protein [Brevibacterium moorei]|uniref:hypothetical protein n=1 Tax=Brevibacterium moorei TaxID=2968457 RepID=UPI00211BD76A|nr:hypothetical protein [Brevibacterium sp. 68QC2CO]MCQ9385128.1 hypothetical protein [Brevibacterium sp. 68QC2CO]